jgi:hypothetical protein
MTNVERVALHRQRKKLGMRPVTVIVSEQDIDYLLASGYRLSRGCKSRARRILDAARFGTAHSWRNCGASRA